MDFEPATEFKINNFFAISVDIQPFYLGCALSFVNLLLIRFNCIHLIVIFIASHFCLFHCRLNTSPITFLRISPASQHCDLSNYYYSY